MGFNLTIGGIEKLLLGPVFSNWVRFMEKCPFIVFSQSLLNSNNSKMIIFLWKYFKNNQSCFKSSERSEGVIIGL